MYKCSAAHAKHKQGLSVNGKRCQLSLLLMPPICAGSADTRGSAPCSNSTEDDVQLLQSQLADWLTHAAVDTSVFSRKAQESGDEAIILQVRLKYLLRLLMPA